MSKLFELPTICYNTAKVKPTDVILPNSNIYCVQWVVMADVSIDIKNTFETTKDIFDIFSIENNTKEGVETVLLLRFKKSVRISNFKDSLFYDSSINTFPKFRYFPFLKFYHVLTYLLEFSQLNSLQLIRSFSDNDLFKMDIIVASNSSFKSKSDLVNNYMELRKPNKSPCPANKNEFSFCDEECSNAEKLNFNEELDILDNLLSQKLSYTKIYKKVPEICKKHPMYFCYFEMDRKNSKFKLSEDSNNNE